MELPEIILAIILGIVAVIGGYAITAAYARAKAAQLEADEARAGLNRERVYRQDVQMRLRGDLDELDRRIKKLEPSGEGAGDARLSALHLDRETFEFFFGRDEVEHSGEAEDIVIYATRRPKPRRDYDRQGNDND